MWKCSRAPNALLYLPKISHPLMLYALVWSLSVSHILLAMPLSFIKSDGLVTPVCQANSACCTDLAFTMLLMRVLKKHLSFVRSSVDLASIDPNGAFRVMEADQPRSHKHQHRVAQRTFFNFSLYMKDAPQSTHSAQENSFERVLD